MSDIRLLLIYNGYTLHTTTVREHVLGLMNMKSFSVLAIDIAELTQEHIQMVDGIIMHYSVRLAFPETIPRKQLHLLLESKIPTFNFIQDEYDNTEVTRSLLEQLEPRIVFTCVPQSNLERVYPRSRFPETRFVTVLTGFLPTLIKKSIRGSSFEARPIDIGYRGRKIGHRYGRLGFYKWFIGEGVVEKLSGREDVVVDISSEERSRVYGDEWFEFLSRCKATLASESGSNVFDDLGAIAKLEQAHPKLTFQEFEGRFLKDKEVDFMGQISPRIFEAIATKTLLILFPGEYSGILKKDIHYLELARDFSNLEHVLTKVQNKSFWNEMTQKAYFDIALNLDYSAFGYFNKIEKELVHFFNEVPSSIEYAQCNLDFSAICLSENTKVANNVDSKTSIVENTRIFETSSKSRILDSLRNVAWIRLLWRKIPLRFRYRTFALISRIIP